MTDADKEARRRAAKIRLEQRRARISEALPSLVIKNDRELLDVMRLSDAEAVMLLGKARQALSNKLGPYTERWEKIPFDYFGLGELLVLFTSARKMGKEIGRVSLAQLHDYVEATRKPHPDDEYARNADRDLDEETYDLFTKALEDSTGFDTGSLNDVDISAVVVLMRDVDDFLAALPEEAAQLRAFIHDLKDRNAGASVSALSATDVKTKALGRWLGAAISANQIDNQVVDHYGPTVLVYRIGERLPLALTVWPRLGLVEAANYRVKDMSNCVLSMLPDPIVDQISEDMASAPAHTSSGG